MKYKAQWFKLQKISDEHLSLKVTQIYTWLYTLDKKLIIVSKDGENWQFPGGHPKKNESVIRTAIREVKEETGIDISDKKEQITIFGYYRIDALEGNKIKKRFIQLRTYLKLDKTTSQLRLTVLEQEDERQEDKIQFVKAVSLDEALELIPWLAAKDEYFTLRSIRFFE